jgi:hypothetical protein
MNTIKLIETLFCYLVFWLYGFNIGGFECKWYGSSPLCGSSEDYGKGCWTGYKRLWCRCGKRCENFLSHIPIDIHGGDGCQFHEREL